MALPAATTNHAFTATEFQNVLDAIGNTVVVATAQSVVSSTTLVDITGFAFTLPNSTATYIFESLLFYDGATTGDLKLGLVVPAGSAVRWEASSALSGDASPGASWYNAAFIATGNPIMGAFGTGQIQVGLCKGTILMGGTAGTFKMQMAQGTSNATASRVLDSSYLTVRRVV